MKKLILFFLLVPAAMICQNKIEVPIIKNENATAGSLVDSKKFELNIATSQVEQVDGIYIFAYSKPVKKYRVIGTVKPGFGQHDYEFIGERLVNKIKKKYPTAQAVIILMETYGAFKDCEVIEFID